MRRSRILYVSPYWPHRATCAAELRGRHIALALQELGEVEIVVIDGEGGGEEWLAQERKEFKVAYGVPISPRPNKRLRDKVRWALSPHVEYPHGYGVDDAATRRVLQTADQFDLVWFYMLRTANMFPVPTWRRSVVDINDVPSTYELAFLEQPLPMPQRLSTRVRIRSWRQREQRLGSRFSALSVCSATDKQYLQELGVNIPMHVVPNGYERPAVVPPRRPASPPRLGFIGIFDYEPNHEGARWFARECWPRIKTLVPDARLRLVGRFSDGPLKPDGPDIDGLGFVDDPSEEISTWSAMVVPIQFGAGTRGKIAHAFSLRCPVISTALGAYGYDARNGQTMYLADSAEDFAAACLTAIREPAAAEAVAERAWEEFNHKWCWDAIKPHIWAAAEDGLRDRAPARMEVR
jgi:glycosyl transferase family 1